MTAQQIESGPSTDGRDSTGVASGSATTAGITPVCVPSAPDATSVDRTAWLDWRRHGVGASEVAGIIGLSPWSSPWSIFAEKVGLIDGPDETEAMEFGLMAEPMLKGYFERRTGLWVMGEQTWCQHPDEPWMRATVDGFVLESHSGSDDPADAIGNVEFKTTSDPPWDEVPVQYQCQASWQMAVTGMPKCWFGVLHIAFGRPTFRVYEFDRDDTDIAMLIGRCRTFWFDHVLTGTPPAADAHPATTEALAEAWEADTEETVDVTDVAIFGTVHRLVNLKAEAKKLEERIAGAENEIKAALGSATALTAGLDAKGKPLTLLTWRPQQRNTIDAKALRAAHPDIAAEFTNTNESRVLLLKLKGD